MKPKNEGTLRCCVKAHALQYTNGLKSERFSIELAVRQRDADGPKNIYPPKVLFKLLVLRGLADLPRSGTQSDLSMDDEPEEKSVACAE